MPRNDKRLTRRDFVATTAAGAALAATPMALARGTRAGGDDAMRCGVVGCGGRGTGAAVNAMQAHPSTRIVAMADLFPDRLQSSLGHLRNQAEYADRITVKEEDTYTGIDAYRQLMARNDIDMVILATPPHFRPYHFEEAIRQGHHVFMEKPVAVDPVGVRRVIEAAESADRQGLSVVAGTQRRHQPNYIEAMERIRDGALGDVVMGRCYWNMGGLWSHEPREEWSPMEWQLRNWLYFTWLSGDHICEQHIHNIDVVNWAMGGPPVKAVGMGGRQMRTEDRYGHIFDHFAIDFEYPGDRHAISMCRQTDGCAGRVEEHIHGSKGTMHLYPGRSVIVGETEWSFAGPTPNPYVEEHRNLAASIRGEGPRLNEGRRVAESTLTAIMGRMSAYTGQDVTWEQAMNSKLDLTPPSYEFGAIDTPPVPRPGTDPLI
tara:strand:+ start:33119 stop:34411 length:1293 start_codon:yes stop_codon:yes gene_type:complete